MESKSKINYKRRKGIKIKVSSIPVSGSGEWVPLQLGKSWIYTKMFNMVWFSETLKSETLQVSESLSSDKTEHTVSMLKV